MAKHTYSITINQTPAGQDVLEYTFRKMPCTLSCSKDAACVRFSMSKAKTHDDLISFRVDLVKDAMRKMYLYHALRFDSRLEALSVIVTVDGEDRTYDQDYPDFPFLYSMLTCEHLDLPESWRDRDFLTTVLSATKTKSDNDHRYVCLFSFLAGTGKVYESERFTCYWTAVNALYNHIFSCANPYHAASDKKIRYVEEAFNKPVLSGDATGLSILLRMFGSGSKISTKQNRTEFRQQYGAIKSHLRTVSRDDLPELYRQLCKHRTDLTWSPKGPLGSHLRDCCARTGSSCWGFLLFDYAYYIRCKYLHGEKAPILFTASTDPELAAFRALNVFLGEFLKEMIPRIFREDWFTAETYRTVCPARK